MGRREQQLPPVEAKFHHNVDKLLVWRKKLPRVRIAVLPTSTFRSNPLPIGDRLFVSAFAPGAVVAVERATGKLIWRYAVTPYSGGELLRTGSTLYATSPHSLYALDPKEGHVRWQFSPRGATGETMYSAPSVHDGQLFIGDRGGYLHALDAKTGTRRWSLRTSRARNNQVNGPPLIHGHSVLVATNAGRVLSLDAHTGSINWIQEIGSPSTREIGIVPGAFLIAAWRSLWWLDQKTGAVLSKVFFRNRSILNYICRGDRALAVLTHKCGGEREIVGLHGSRVAFRRKVQFLLNLRWLSDGSVAECRADGLGILDPDTGQRIHNIRFPAPDIVAPPALHAGRLYVLSGHGILWALRWPLPDDDAMNMESGYPE